MSTTEHQNPTPSPQVRALDRLVGRWTVTGAATGTVEYQWLDGGFFLQQTVELEQDGDRVTGIELIGHLRPFMAEPSDHVASRFFDSQGNTLDYSHEIDGDTYTIWAGEPGAPAYYRGTFDASGDVITGDWVYPGGGGYHSVQTRIS